MNEITKKKILSLYPGQPRTTYDMFNSSIQDKVIVKPLSGIKENEIYTVWNTCLEKYSDSQTMSIQSIKNFILSLWSDEQQSNEPMVAVRPNDLLKVADCLRSIGYAIPAFGYTVSQLESEGVFKISGSSSLSDNNQAEKIQTGWLNQSDSFRIVDSGKVKFSNGHKDSYIGNRL